METLTITLTWTLDAPAADRHGLVRRYCPSCGAVAAFRDSRVRRHNANGKTIRQYAIYKCGKDHTWNRKLDDYKASCHNSKYLAPETQNDERDGAPPRKEAWSAGASRCTVDILVRRVEGRWRLDKLLAERLDGVSRSQIAKWIQTGRILLNGVRVKACAPVAAGCRITIQPE